MKILIVNYEFPPLGGGGGIGTYYIGKELARENEVDILTTGYQNLAKTEIRNRMKIYRVPVLLRKELATATITSMVSYFFSSVYYGKKLLKANKYDVINTWFAIPSGPTGMYLSKSTKIPNVLTVIGGDIYDPSKWYSAHRKFNFLLHSTVKQVINSADAVIAISTDVKNRVYQYYNVPKKIEIIPLAIDEPIYTPVSRTMLNLNEQDFYLITVARLIKRKGLHYLLESLACLQYPDIKLLIIGEGPEQNSLSALAEKLGIAEKVIFLGPIFGEKKFQYLANSDVFVLPSLHEGLGLVFLEAMSVGLPIIASDAGGQTDFLEHNKTGFLVPIGDVEKLAESIRTLYHNAEQRKQMGIHNKEIVRNYFSENIAKKYKNLFDNIVYERR